MTDRKTDERFDRLLEAMTGPNAEKPSSTPKASSRGDGADCDETRTPQILLEMFRTNVDMRPVDAAL